MSTRQRKNKSTPPTPSLDTDGTTNGGQHLPPKRQGKIVRHDVSKPMEHISISTLVYMIVAFGTLLIFFYTYRITQLKAEVGGWWNLLLGQRPPQTQTMGSYDRSQDRGSNKAGKELGLEDHISSIASILDMQPTDLASAVSAVVSQHIAPKSASSLSASVSSSASAAGTSAPAADSLFNDANPGSEGASASDDEGALGTAGRVAQAVEAIIGFDEPIVVAD